MLVYGPTFADLWTIFLDANRPNLDSAAPFVVVNPVFCDIKIKKHVELTSIVTSQRIQDFFFSAYYVALGRFWSASVLLEP